MKKNRRVVRRFFYLLPYCDSLFFSFRSGNNAHQRTRYAKMFCERRDDRLVCAILLRPRRNGNDILPGFFLFYVCLFDTRLHLYEQPHKNSVID